MDAGRAQRIYICLHQLINLVELLPNNECGSKIPHYTELQKLISKPEYQEMKEWLRMK